MKYKLLFASLLLCSLTNVSASACPTGDPKSIRYIRRNNNRCEGIIGINDNIPISATFQLISIATRNLNKWGETLTIQLPPVANSSNPEVKLRSIEQDYQLDKIDIPPNTSRFSFSTYVLKKAQIPVNRLRAIAWVNFEDLAHTYIPVKIGNPSHEYEFVFFTSNWTKINKFTILHDGKKEVYSHQRRNSQSPGEIIFKWEASNAPTGRYVLKIEAEVDRRGVVAPESIKQDIVFFHDQTWLNQ
ncbi:hypothetical protein [Coleofasciculus sp.]|uniref:hypothetical protein n=1 Tax=Coleofasciculus sp. TaxID=3100458 RepID=UPI0039F931BB